MSAWAEWKHGLITDSEYRSIMREEELRDRDYLLGEEYEDEDEDDYIEEDETEGE